MAACREEYMEEINIVEHIMQFREIKAQLDENAAAPAVTTRLSLNSKRQESLKREKTKRAARHKRKSVFDDGTIRDTIDSLAIQ